MSRTWWISGSLLGFLAVAMGAFGAHALSGSLSEKSLAVYQTAAHYHLIHAVALLAVGAWAAQHPGTGTTAGWLFLSGTIVFSGSLYALALTDIKWLGAITPIGGTLFLAGWLSLAWTAWRT
jgi:uncharacterized membrane protein YgdD (TMEM256/DUF423 family)